MRCSDCSGTGWRARKDPTPRPHRQRQDESHSRELAGGHHPPELSCGADEVKFRWELTTRRCSPVATVSTPSSPSRCPTLNQTAVSSTRDTFVAHDTKLLSASAANAGLEHHRTNRLRHRWQEDDVAAAPAKSSRSEPSGKLVPLVSAKVRFGSDMCPTSWSPLIAHGIGAKQHIRESYARDGGETSLLHVVGSGYGCLH